MSKKSKKSSKKTDEKYAKLASKRAALHDVDERDLPAGLCRIYDGDGDYHVGSVEEHPCYGYG